ncbi:hypothetical protein CerSpe_227840 [Prunus speciosa]
MVTKRRRTASSSNTATMVTKKTRTTSSPNWSELQPQLLNLIMKNLSITDLLRFKAVCSSWNHAMESYFSGSASGPQTPWLMLPPIQQNRTHNYNDTTRCFYNFQEKKLYTIESAFQDFDNAWCVGSSHGWLVILDKRANPLLLNPISGNRIKLPLFWPVDRSIDENLRKTYIAKAILSSGPSGKYNNFVVVIIYGRLLDLPAPLKLAFCKYGGTWTSLEGKHRAYSDIIFHNNQLFAFAEHGSVEVWDFKNTSFPIRIINLHRPSLGSLQDRSNILKFRSWEFSTQTYLVESLGEILFVGRVKGNFLDCQGRAVDPLSPGDEDCFPYRTMQFYIFKLNLSAKKWEKVECLPDRGLFLGGNQSISLSTIDFPEFEENSIYFTDDKWDEISFKFHGFANDYGGHDNGIYSIQDKVVKPFDQFGKWRIDPPPFWIVPNPW